MNMYDITTKHLVQQWGGWLNSFEWDYFSTITYKFDISPRRNESLMLELEKRLIKEVPIHNMFWVMEHTSNGYQTHNHLLLSGDGSRYEVDRFLSERKLVNPKFVQHSAYDSSQGATYYISKHIRSPSVKYGISFNK